MIGITGASGVLGSLLLGVLKARGLQHTSFSGDIRKEADVETWIEDCRPDAVFHLAARVPVKVVADDPVGAFEVNATGTLNLVRALSRHNKGCWLFYGSTSHVYRGSPTPVAEDAPTGPHTIYGQTKLVGEQIANYFGHHGGIGVCTGRIFSLYHSTQQPPYLYPSMLDRLKSHDPALPFTVRNGFDIRDFLNAEELIALMMKLYEARATGTVNIGSGKGTRIVDFVRGLAGDSIAIEADQRQEPTILVADTKRLQEIVDGCQA